MRTSPALRGQGIFCAAMLLLVACAGAQAAAQREATRASMTLADSSLPPLRLTSHVVEATISGRVARVSAESVYHNDSARDLEASYVFPLPQRATVEKFVMWMDGKPVEGQVAEKELAKRTYERIVSKRKDPGLVEQIDENVFRFRIFPVPANGDQRVRIEYSQVLPLRSESNQLNFTYPLYNTAPREGARNASSFLVSVALEMESPIAKLESPTHKISQRILPDEPKRGTVSIEEIQSSLDRDFALTITLKDRALPVASLAFRTAAAQGVAQEDGTFMLFITPQLAANEEPAAKDVVLVMDTSGSMEGSKIEQARKALKECLTRLRPKDRFAVISFSDYANSFSDKWTDVNADSLRRATEFVSALNAAGGTNIGEALERAMAFPSEAGRIKQILFATDGLPSVGAHDPAQICKIVTNKKEAQQRVFTLGIGYDVNTTLLDKLAAETRGERAYVRETERIDEKVGNLINKISAPVLSDVSIEFGSSLGIQQLYPPKINDLYLGQQMVLTGKYKNPGSGQIILKGMRNGKEVVIESPLVLPEKTVQATAFIPRQWAMRKTGYLLDQIRLYGENAELKNEVVRLGTQFGIVTPYTSYLALEPADRERFQKEIAQSKLSGIEVPPDILAKAELGDHFETINSDRPDTHSSFGNPDAHMFHSTDAGGGGGNSVPMIEDLPGWPGTGGGWGGGRGTGIGNDMGSGYGVFGQRNGGGRRLMLKKYGGSKATENSVDNALRWLAYHQEVGGNWDARKFGAFEQADVSVTSMALLALLGAGHSEKVGEYKDNVKRAVAWLIAHQRDEGRIENGSTPNAISNEFGDPHSLATLALSEAASMGNIPGTKAAAQLALDYCAKIQTNQSGWGTKPGAEPNLVATTWFIMALKSGKVAGLHVEAAAFDNAVKFLDSVERKTKGNAVTYALSATDAGGVNDAARVALATMCRQMLGWKREDLRETVESFISRGGQPKWGDKVDFSYLYAGTLCAFQQGGELWKSWNENLKATLVANQYKDGDDAGSWRTKEKASPLGRAGETALAALCLETYYRYAQLTPGGVRPMEQVPVSPPKPAGDSGKDAVDYSEYIRKLKEGEGR